MASVRQFRLTPKGEKALAESKGQQKLIVEHMKLANAPQSVKQISEGIVASLQTRQDPERVVAFYMSVWKKKGLVAMAETEEPEGSAAEGEGEDAEDEDEDEDEDEESDEDSAEAESSPAPSGSDLDGASVSQAVLWAIKKDGPQSAEQIARTLAFESYHSPGTGQLVGMESIRGALQNLIRRGEIKKLEGGQYGRR